MEQLTARHLGIRILPQMFIQHSVADLVTNLVCRATENFNEHAHKKNTIQLLEWKLLLEHFFRCHKTSSDPLLFICVDILMTRMPIKVDRIYLQLSTNAWLTNTAERVRQHSRLFETLQGSRCFCNLRLAQQQRAVFSRFANQNLS